MRVVSLFSGAGGLDLGFEKAGFDIIWSNECDIRIQETYRKNHNSYLDTRDIKDIGVEEIPECDGVIGGPPCQSWSVGGASRGIEDPRGKLFFEFIRIVEGKKPKFFLAENVPGILSYKHKSAFEEITGQLRRSGYQLFIKELDAADYAVPQNRKRIAIIGLRMDLNINFEFPRTMLAKKNIKDAIWDLRGSALSVGVNGQPNGNRCKPANHEYLVRGFPQDYKAYDKVRSWDRQAYTVRTNGKYMHIHPDAPHMIKKQERHWEFVEGSEDLYRRFSVRECARLQTFPDNFIFTYDKIEDGYMMVGNAVPVNLAYALAEAIKKSLNSLSLIEGGLARGEKEC